MLIVGQSSVGKSNVLLRFADNVFQESFLPTIGVDFKIRTIESDNSIIKLQMWDTAGQEKFKTITAAYYKGSHGIILMYDVTDRSSFNDLQNWMAEVEKYAPENVRKIIVGNKCDIKTERQVSTKEGRDFAAAMGMDFIETSAKENINVEETFLTLTNSIKQNTSQVPSLKRQKENKEGRLRRDHVKENKPSFFSQMFDCLKFSN